MHGYQVDAKKLKALSLRTLASLGLQDFFLSIRFVGTSAIRTLNRVHRAKDQATDVLSFPQESWAVPATVSRPVKLKTEPHPGPPRVLGDVVISLPEAARNAKKIGQGLDREVCFLVVHGILHLAGHDHERPADERRMLKEQRTLMARLEPKAGAPLWRNCVKTRGAR